MLRSKNFLLLPVASLVGIIILLLTLFGPLREGREAAFSGCASGCWLVAVLCGACVLRVKQKDTDTSKTTKLEWFLVILMGLSWFSFQAVLDPTTGGHAQEVVAMVFYSGAVWCLLSLFITLFIIARDVRNLHTWIIFATQISWVVASFFFSFVRMEYRLKRKRGLANLFKKRRMDGIK